MPLSWFINSKVPGCEGTLWCSDPRVLDGSLRKVFEQDFRRYAAVEWFVRNTGKLFTLEWAPWKRHDTISMYTNQSGCGMFNPFNVFPLYRLCKMVGISEEWWNVVFTPYYTASFLVDNLKPFPAAMAPLIEQQIPLLPNDKNSWQGVSKNGSDDCKLTTCVTW